MKFPPLSLTLKFLKPRQSERSQTQSNSEYESEMTLYDKIEEIFSIAEIDYHSSELIVKFNLLKEIQQQVTLVTLIEHNCVDALSTVLSSKYDVNFLIRGYSPLHFAIKEQNFEIVKLLIKHKANLEFKNNYKETALNFAVRAGNLDIIKYLLEQGANINTQASDRSTPLENAMHLDDIESVNLLKKHGALLGDGYLVKSI